LEHEVEIAHVDPQLQSRRADDAGVRPVSEPLLGRPPLFQGDRRVVNEHVDRTPAHPLRNGLRQRPGLTEEEALLPRSSRCRFPGEARNAVVQRDVEVTLRRVLGRINHDAVSL
jgi:hypothetical protein